MNELEQMLADIPNEGMEVTPSESLPEKPTEVVEPVEGDVPTEEKSEDNLPFHKHPRWIERENELNELREREETMSRELAEIKAFKDSVDIVDNDIPSWFSELYGDNQVAWTKYAQHEQQRTEEIENRILARQQEAQVKEAQEGEHWNKWVDSEINKLQSEGATFDRNKLIKVMLDYSPTDANNNLDFKKGYGIYEALEGKPDTVKSEARKQLADTTTATSTKGEPTKKDYMTPAELRGRSWSNIVSEI
jgi:hypothetical protein